MFGKEVTEVTILDGAGGVRPLPAAGKDEIADAIWDAVLAWPASTPTGAPLE